MLLVFPNHRVSMSKSTNHDSKARAASLYDLLGVFPGASTEDVKRAFRRQALIHHPDKGGDSATFQRLTYALDVLTDTSQRATYDRSLPANTPVDSRPIRPVPSVALPFIPEAEAYGTHDLVDITLITIGACQVGKTALIDSLFNDEHVGRMSSYVPTIGVDYGFRFLRLGDRPVRLHIFDLSGHDLFKEARCEFYGKATGVVLCFDVTRAHTLHEVGTKWVKELRDHGLELEASRPRSVDSIRPAAILVGCKADDTELTDNARQAISKDTTDLSKKLGVEYFATSAADGMGIGSCFLALLKSGIDIR